MYDWIKILSVSDKKVVVASGDSELALSVGPHADLMIHGEIALVGVTTIGPKLDQEVRELNSSGQVLLAYLLDCIGVIALSEVGKRVSAVAEREAQCRGWGVSARLNPGSLVGWPLSDQAVLCTLIPLEMIRVSLNSHGVLVPLKSVTTTIALGPDYPSKKVGSVCHLCMHDGTCWRRREREVISDSSNFAPAAQP